MFRRQLKFKLFLIFLATVALVIALMLVMMNWSFKRGFVDYLNQSDKTQLTPVVERLEDYYASHDSWDDLQQNPNIWRELTRPADAEPPAHMPPHREAGFGDRFNNPSWPPPRHPSPMRMEPPDFANPPASDRTAIAPKSTSLELGPRLSLFDSKRQHIIGRASKMNDANCTPLHNDWQLIGWLSIEPVSTPSQSRDLAFVQQQANNLYIIAAIALLIAALVSVILARRLLQPISALTAGARSLTQGNYETQIEVSGKDELGQLAEDFNILSNTLAANESARRRWIADISHELRTPLAVLRGEVEALQDGVRPTDDKSLQSLHSEVGQLNKLVDDLYQLSLSDLGALNYQKVEQNISDVIEQTCDSFRARFNNANIELKLKLANEPLWALADSERISQLLHNLLENTLRYTDSGGSMEISGHVDGTQIQIDIHDSAPGVEQALLPRLFDPLYRTEASRNRARGGAGLGLAIVRNIVSAHQGEIDAQPSHLGGVWIRITLPKATGATA
ncbi:MAG: ATP-binding protein [Gammaproteobacteria bacterium]|nr:ATP-binding protein [Gammaproteobacteria bacterium]